MRSSTSAKSLAAGSLSANQSNVVIGNRPTVPKRVVTGNKNVQKILGDLEKIKKAAKTKKPAKLHAMCEELVYHVVNVVRNLVDRDHLIETSVIWALITILRIEPHSNKAVMMSAGVPLWACPGCRC